MAESPVMAPDFILIFNTVFSVARGAFIIVLAVSRKLKNVLQVALFHTSKSRGKSVNNVDD